VTRAELEDRYAAVDTLLTIHTELKDRAISRARSVDIVILFSSAIICIVEFIDPAVLIEIGASAKASHLVSGGASILIFLLSIYAIRVDYRNASDSHSRAAEVLARLKSELGSQLRSDKVEAAETEDLCRSAAKLIHGLPRITESRFHKLRALHRRKLILNKMIDENPGAPVWLLSMILWAKSVGSAIHVQK
jgi:hypothetical protein